MRTKRKVSAAIFGAAILLFFAMDFATGPQGVEPPAGGTDAQGAGAVPQAPHAPRSGTAPTADPATPSVGPSPEAGVVSAEGAAVAGSHVLRLILEGIHEEHAGATTVTMRGRLDESDARDAESADFEQSWPCTGLTSEFALDRLLERMAENLGADAVIGLAIEVEHSMHRLETTRIPLTGGVEGEGGRVLFEARVRLVPVEFWPRCEIHFEFRVDGAALPSDDPIWNELTRGASEKVRPVDHDGELAGIDAYSKERLVEVSAPGAYEITFDGVGSDRFEPIPPHRVVVRAGAVADVIVELRRQ